MADVKWIKLCTDTFEDEKIILLLAQPNGYMAYTIWNMLLCRAGRNNNGGIFMADEHTPFTEESLIRILRIPIEDGKIAFETLKTMGLIKIINGAITIPKWDKHQSLDKMEKAKEKTRKRVAKHREKTNEEKSKNQDCNAPKADICNAMCNGDVTVCNDLCNGDVTQCNATEVEVEVEKEKEELEKELEVDVVVNACDNNGDTNNKLSRYKNKVFLTENQVDDLLEKLGLEVFDMYLEKLDNFILSNNANVKNHYKTILKWAKEDGTLIQK